MKTKVFIALLLGQVLLVSASWGYTTTKQDKLKILNLFLDREILYNDTVTVDSVIEWSEQLYSSTKANKNSEQFFLLQLQLANAYTLRGDISLATDQALLMYNEAKEADYPFGMVVANQAVGDAYNTIANLGEKALESYRDALNELSQISPNHPYRAKILLKISNVLQRKSRLNEAKKVLDELEAILQKEPNYTTEFFFTIEKTNFAISQGHLSKDYLTEAATHLHKLDSIYRLHSEKHYRFHLEYITAAYYRAMGSWDKKYWDKSLEIYSKLQTEYATNTRSTYYHWVSIEKIYLCKIKGMPMEACRIYQELYPPIDTLASQNYIRQINTIKAKYQIDKIAVTNHKEFSKMITSILIGCLAILVLFILLAIRLRKQRKRIKYSTHLLSISRFNAENATKAKSVFLSNMSHEIRTPLNALSGFSALLTEEGLDNDTRRQCNEVIQQNSELLLKLINDVIDLSSLEFGKLQFSLGQHDAVIICQNVIDTVNKVKQTQAEVVFTTEQKKLLIETDDSRLQQVLINLLINATKFTPQGTITLMLTQEEENTALFCVTDTGCGIPKEKQGAIFQRFEKLNENAQGSGLGLSICQLIIEHVGGQIWIDSKYTEGSRFCFTHPVRQPYTDKKEDNP